MLTRIKEMKVTKGLLGVMLASIILSVPAFAISIRGVEVTDQPVTTVKTTAKSSLVKPMQKTAAPPATSVAAVVPKPAPTAAQHNAAQPQPTPARSLSPADLQLLARVIYAESRGEPFEGQVAVGAVLLNRLNDSRFPRTLTQIIFKQGEFCTVRDGQIWNTPNPEAIKAAKLAVAGWDPTGGAVYFYNPAKTTSRWIWSRVVTNKIGNHIFAA